jgi:uncharacterized SAM-binding protein YcdF (DUF218 family)
MLFLHKFLPIFFLPIGLSLLFIAAGLLLKRKEPIVIAAALLWVFSMPVTGDILMKLISGGHGRMSVAAMPEADAIVVLSGMIQVVEGAPLGEWNEAADRFEGGVELYRAGKAPLLVFTGGWIPWKPKHPPEGELLAERAAALGVPREAIRVTEKVQNTAEEAVAISRMSLSKEGKRTAILLVTSAYHMPRSRLLFERAGLEVIPYPVDLGFERDIETTLLRFLPNAEALQESESVLRELLGLAYYRVKMMGVAFK